MKYLKKYNEDIDWIWDIEEEPENEEIVPGDKILILPKLKEYIIKNKWERGMYNLIGKKFKVAFIEPKTIRGESFIAYYFNLPFDVTYYVPGDCVKKV